MTQHTITYDDATRERMGKAISDFMEQYGDDDDAGQCTLDWCDSDNVDALLDAVLAAAQKPEAASRTVPSDDDIERLWRECNGPYCASLVFADNFARALLSRYGQPAATIIPGEIHDIMHSGTTVVLFFESVEAARSAYNAIEGAHRVAVNIGQPAASVEPVAVVGDQFSLFWIGSGPIAPLIERHGIKVGSKLYAASVTQAQQPAASAEPVALKRISAASMLELKAAIYKHHGWQREAGESMSARISTLYDMTADHQAGRFGAVPKGATQATASARPVAWPVVTWWDGAQGPAERLAESLDNYAKIKPGANRDVWAMRAAAKWIRAVLAAPVAAQAQPVVTGPTHTCGGIMTRNPHPDAGKSGHTLTEGCEWECIPCTVKSRHDWSQRALAAEKKLREISQPVVNQSLVTEREAFNQQDLRGPLGEALSEGREREIAWNAWQARAALAQQPSARTKDIEDAHWIADHLNGSDPGAGPIEAMHECIDRLATHVQQPSTQDREDAAALRKILMDSPEPVSYPNESWADAYAEWHTTAIDAARAAKEE